MDTTTKEKEEEILKDRATLDGLDQLRDLGAVFDADSLALIARLRARVDGERALDDDPTPDSERDA